SYRYHEVLRSHLDRMLVEEVGEVEARQRHQRAASLLERSGALPEALVGYCRAEDWPAVSSLVGNRGEQVAVGPGLRLELLPAAGEVGEAKRALTAASQQEELDPALGAAAAVAAAVATLLQGEPSADHQLADAIDIAERSGLPWLASMGRIAGRIGGIEVDGATQADLPTAEALGADADPWGALFGGLVAAWVARPDGQAPAAPVGQAE